MPYKWLLAIVFTVALAAPGDAKPRVRFGGFSVGAGYAHFSGFPYYPYVPFYYGPLFPAYYDPFLYGFYPGYFTGYGYQPNLGEVKIRGLASRKASVYLNGAYAGEASKLKSIWLDPGAYNLEIRTEGRDMFEKRIYVLTGKTLDLRPWEKHP